MPAGPQTSYTKLQEEVRKDIERLFGVVQGRFRILRRESDLWAVEDVVLVSEVFQILHSILIRMQQSRGFYDETQGEEDCFDIVCQFMYEDSRRIKERG